MKPWSVEECESYAKQLRNKTRANTAEHAAQAIEYLLGLLKREEPVAWRWENEGKDNLLNKYTYLDNGAPDYPEECEPLYTTPPQREWVGLDGEIPGLGLVTEEFYNGMIFAEDILRERNGG